MGRDVADVHRALFATSHTGHDKILKWNWFEDTTGNCAIFRIDLSSWDVTFWLPFQSNWTCFAFVIDMLHFFCFLFLINFQRHMHSICVWNMIKESKPIETRYDTTYIYDRYNIRTHVYVFLFSVKKRVFELSRVWPWRWPRGCTPYMVFIGPVFHNTIKTCLKREVKRGKRNVSVCRGHELANTL